MGFLAPLFFLGVAALAVPILVHLFQRERREPVRFPSLMFLRQVPYKSVRQRRIRNWPLFLLRSLAVLLLVLAFTRPFLDRDLAAAGPLADAREVVILLDRSYSMDYAGRWEQAVAAAGEVIAGLRPEDRATLVTFDGAAATVTQPGAEPARLRAALDTLRPGSGITRFTPALKVAQGLLSGSDRPRGEVVLISDFQRSAWDGDPSARLPAGATLRAVQVGDTAGTNAAVAGVDIRRETVGGRERVTVAARIATRGGEAREIPAVLELDGREAQRIGVSAPATGIATAEFSPVTVPAEGARGIVRIGPDDLPADDAFHFSLSSSQAIGVLIVNGRRAGQSLFLERALGLGQEPPFRVQVVAAGSVRPADLDGKRVVIINDAPFPTGEAGRRLHEMVESGGGLIVAAGDGATSGWSEAPDLLPGTPGETRDRGSGGGIGYVDYSSRIFELFRAPRSGDFVGARFYRYRTLGGTLQEGVLARFDDGVPALVERRVGSGRVLVWGSTFDTYWNDLALQPVFLPFVHQLVRHASGFSEPRPHFQVGDVVEIGAGGATARGEEAEDSAAATAAGEGPAGVPGSAAERWIAITPAGGRVDVPNGLLRLDEAGFYEVRAERDAGSAWSVAANVDLAESDLAGMDPAALEAAVVPPGSAEARLARTEAPSVEERERRQSLWWYLLAGAFALLAAETALANRASRRVART